MWPLPNLGSPIVWLHVNRKRVAHIPDLHSVGLNAGLKPTLVLDKHPFRDEKDTRLNHQHSC